MHKRYINALLTAVLFLFCPADAGSNGTINIAVIADKAFDLDQSHLVSILEVELSQTEGIQVLERTRIDKILQEQQLSLTGLADRNAIVKAGQLLRADAFILLSQESSGSDAEPSQSLTNDEKDDALSQQDNSEKKQLIRVRLVETLHGVILWQGYEQIDEVSIGRTARKIIEKVCNVTGKIGLPAGQIVPVGIIGIHRVQLPERFEKFTRILPSLLSVRLSQEPKIIMLEREDLKILSQEKVLTEGHDVDFWNSGILIDGYIQRSNDNDIDMKLNIRKATGESLSTIDVPIEPNLPSAGIEKASEEIIKTILDSPPSGNWNPEAEAEEFFRQGAFLLAHERYSEAVIPLETAHALQPGTLKYTSELFKNEWQSRLSEYRKGDKPKPEHSTYSDLELAELASLLVRQIRRDYKEEDPLYSRYLYNQWGGLLGIKPDKSSYFGHYASTSSEPIKQINKENRRIWADTMDKALKKRPHGTGYPYPYVIATLPWIGYQEPNELISSLKKAYTEVLFSNDMGGTIWCNNCRSNFSHHVLWQAYKYRSPEELKKSHLCDSEEYFADLWNDYLDELLVSSDPIVKFHACTSQANWLITTAVNRDYELAKEYCNTAQNVLLNDLLGPKHFTLNLTNATKLRLCNEYKQVLLNVYIREQNKLVEIWESILNPLIEKNDVISLTFWDPGQTTLIITPDLLQPDVAKKYYDLLGRIDVILRPHIKDQFIGRASSRVSDCRAEIELKYPLLNLNKKQSPVSVDMLVSQGDLFEKPKREYCEIEMQLNENILYVAILSQDYPYILTFVCIDLAQKRKTALWQTTIKSNSLYLTGLAVNDIKSYVSVMNYGLIVLPGGLSKEQGLMWEHKVLNQQNGLPSELITSMTANRDRLWIAYGGNEHESGLGLYEPITGNWETIFCSTMKDKQPFNGGFPYTLRRLTATIPDKLFFVMDRTKFPDMVRWVGLWVMNIETRTLKYLGRTGIIDDGPLGYIDAADGECWLKGSTTIVRFDPESEQNTYIIGRRKPHFLNENTTILGIEYKYDDFIPDTSISKIPFGYYNSGLLDLATSAIHGDKLWARLGRSQIAILYRDKSYDEAKIIDNDILDGEPVSRFVSTPYGLVAIGNGTVGLIDTESIKK